MGRPSITENSAKLYGVSDEGRAALHRVANGRPLPKDALLLYDEIRRARVYGWVTALVGGVFGILILLFWSV